MSRRKLTLTVHGEWGSGKSTLADTAPGPRLIFDAEGGVQFTPSRKVEWNGKTNPNELDLGPDDSAVVTVHDVDVMYSAHQWLTQAEHPFRSVIADSVTEVQQRQKDRIKPAGQRMLQNDWGELTDRTIGMIRTLRDYTLGMHPVDVVVMVCGSAEKGQDHPVTRPMLQGSAAEKILGYVDVGMYMSVEENAEGVLQFHGLVRPLNGIAAKDRTGRLGTDLISPTIPMMLDMIYKTKEDASG